MQVKIVSAASARFMLGLLGLLGRAGIECLADHFLGDPFLAIHSCRDIAVRLWRSIRRGLKVNTKYWELMRLHLHRPVTSAMPLNPLCRLLNASGRIWRDRGVGFEVRLREAEPEPSLAPRGESHGYFHISPFV